MRNSLTSLMPSRIGGQITLLVVTSLVLAHVLMAAAFLVFEPRTLRPDDAIASVERLVFLERMLNAETSAEAKAALLASARKADSALIVLKDLAPLEIDETASRLFRGASVRPGEDTNLLVGRLPLPLTAPRDLLAVAKLSDGRAIALPVTLPPPPLRLISPVAIGTLVFLASAVTLLSLWAARQLTAPLTKFADAAERFTAESLTAPLPESGPVEVRRVAKALNDMQQRVLTLIADRTRMLAAVSHDLRTPITRLRLRAEDVANEKLRSQFLADLTTMQNLVQSALFFLRGQVEPACKIKTDLPALVQTVCDGFSDIGGAVTYSGPAHLYVTCEPEQMMRAIENLVDNGLKFGKSVTVRVVRQREAAIIDIQDDGPGIDDTEKERAAEPFYRGDSARNLDNGDSFGLGLSIAQAIIERNGGVLELLDGVPTGLLARVSLPLAEES